MEIKSLHIMHSEYNRTSKGSSELVKSMQMSISSYSVSKDLSRNVDIKVIQVPSSLCSGVYHQIPAIRDFSSKNHSNMASDVVNAAIGFLKH